METFQIKAYSWVIYIVTLLTIVFGGSALGIALLPTKGSPTIWQTEKVISINPDTSSYPIFKTLDSNSANQELKEKGINVGEVIDDGFVSYFHFFDPDGNILEACHVHE